MRVRVRVRGARGKDVGAKGVDDKVFLAFGLDRSRTLCADQVDDLLWCESARRRESKKGASNARPRPSLARKAMKDDLLARVDRHSDLFHQLDHLSDRGHPSVPPVDDHVAQIDAFKELCGWGVEDFDARDDEADVVLVCEALDVLSLEGKRHSSDHRVDLLHERQVGRCEGVGGLVKGASACHHIAKVAGPHCCCFCGTIGCLIV